MRIIIEIGHPAHVHHFKQMYWELQKNGHIGLFVAKDKECSLDLLNSYNLPYKTIGKTKKGMLKKIIGILVSDIKLLLVAIRFKPDLFISRISPTSAHVCMLLRKHHICFADTESSKGYDWIAMPGVEYILNSTTYKRDHGAKQLRYPGYHELAYLHPNRFSPDDSVLQRLGIQKEEPFAIVRFVSWIAHHDHGFKGMNCDNKLKLIRELSKRLKVFISSEGELPHSLKAYQINIPVSDMHSVLYYARMFIGESATMASECAMLGTPAIYINDSQLGYTCDLADRGLVYSFTSSSKDQTAAMEKAIELAQDITSKNTLLSIRDSKLHDMIDVTSFMVWFIENYPRSVRAMKKPGFDFSKFY